VDIAAAWGQDPDSKSRWSDESKALDLGTVVLPFTTVRASKYVELVNDVENDGQVSPGDTVKYTIRIMNVGQVDVAAGALRVFDPSLNHMDYVEGTCTYSADAGDTTRSVSDSNNGTPFPLDVEGLATKFVLPRRGGVHEISFLAIVDPELDISYGITELVNAGYVTQTNRPDLPFRVDEPLSFPPKPTAAPTNRPTRAPTKAPTSQPTIAPTEAPSSKPTNAPTSKPTNAPTSTPTNAPSASPIDPTKYVTYPAPPRTPGKYQLNPRSGARTIRYDHYVLTVSCISSCATISY
jgi:uncharacterized repeat protein (TIGR01451 family)